MLKILRHLFSFTASYGLSVLLLLLLMVLVLFGTLEQTHSGLHEVQQRYFSSLFVVHPLFGWFPLPLPGGYLLLGLLFVNMLFGAIIRAPKRFSRLGLLLAHGGVLFLVLAAFVSHHYAINGNMSLYEEQSSSQFQSYYDWEIRITEIEPESSGSIFIIPQCDFEDMAASAYRVFYASALPFELHVTQYHKNCQPIQGTGPWAVEGIVLESFSGTDTAEQEIPGVFLSIHEIENPEEAGRVGLLWGLERAPWQITAAGRKYSLSLQRRTWELPFSLRLKKFNHEMHPGTATPSHFSSEMQLAEGNVDRNIIIRMNEPLRHRGFTFYQSSWGPADAPPGTPLYSVLAVTHNPAGQWPLYASCVISLGLLLHFSQMLLRYLKQQSVSAAVVKDEKE